MEGFMVVIYFVIVLLLIIFQYRVKNKKEKPYKRTIPKTHTVFKSSEEERKWKKSGDVMHINHYHNEMKHKHYSADPCAYSEHFSWVKGSKNIYDDPWDFK